jgi:anti-sigma factor RsiW
MGRASGPEARVIRDHLKTCKECEALLREEMAFAARLSAVPMVEPANDVWALVRAKTKPRRLSISAWLGRTRSVDALAKRLAAAVAVIGVAAVTLYSVTLNQPDTGQEPVATSGNSVVSVKWSDDPLGGHREVLVECIDKM